MRPSDFEFLQALVRKQSAIVIENGKEYLVEARLEPVAMQEGYRDLQGLVAALQQGGSAELEERVVEAMTTNETSFFRDHTPFEMLKNDLLPELMKSREKSRKLNIWCAAASSGQEPYSLAMLMKQDLPALENWTLDILATDISKNILERAESGIYSQLEVNRGLPVSCLVKFFKQNGKTWVLRDDIREMIKFRQLNLIGTWPSMPQQDLILIRNVLIYFDIETKKQILTKLREILAPDGYILLGGAETTVNIDDSLERVQFDKGACYRIRR